MDKDATTHVGVATIKLSQPKAYGRILPLATIRRQPIRPQSVRPSTIVVPEIEDRPNCCECRTVACRTGRCDWPKGGES